MQQKWNLIPELVVQIRCTEQLDKQLTRMGDTSSIEWCLILEMSLEHTHERKLHNDNVYYYMY